MDLLDSLNRQMFTTWLCVKLNMHGNNGSVMSATFFILKQPSLPAYFMDYENTSALLAEFHAAETMTISALVVSLLLIPNTALSEIHGMAGAVLALSAFLIT